MCKSENWNKLKMSNNSKLAMSCPAGKITRNTLTGMRTKVLEVITDVGWREVTWEGVRKKGFALHWMLSGSRTNSTTGRSNKSCQEGGKIKSRL